MRLPNPLRKPVEVMVPVFGGMDADGGSVAQGSVKPMLYGLTDALIARKQKLGVSKVW